MTWEEFIRSTPWVATLQTFNNDWTIYASLQQVCKQFDVVFIVDDGSTDNTLLEIDRFIRREKPLNLHVFDLSSINLHKDVELPKIEGTISTKKTQIKFKAFSLAKQLIPNGIWVSVEPDVILSDDARSRMHNRVKTWIDPYTDCEFFNLVTMIDPFHAVDVFLSKEKTTFPEGIQHKREYHDNGYCGLVISWLGGKLYPEQEQANSIGLNFFPWLQKNQIEKKGQDNTQPYGFHLLSYREDEKDTNYIDHRSLKISDLSDSNVDLSLLCRVRFPVIAKLNDKGQREIISCEW